MTRGSIAFTAQDENTIGDFFDHVRHIGESYGIDVYGAHWDGVHVDLLDTFEPPTIPGTSRAI